MWHIYSVGGNYGGAFAALKADGTVVAWGGKNYGGDCSDVQEQLVDVRYIYPTSSAFAALKGDGVLR